MKQCYVCGKSVDKWDNPKRKSKYCSRYCVEWEKKNFKKKKNDV